MKIAHVLGFILSVLCVLFIVSFLFPQDGINVLDSYTLEFPSPKDVFVEDEAPVDMEKVLVKNINLDSLIRDTLKVSKDSVVLDAATLKTLLEPLEYGSNTDSIMYPFFEALHQLKAKGNLIRVMHYGDSQIECDRITSFLRSKLQTQFGGSGIGMMSVVQPFNYQYALAANASSEWKRYTVFGKRDSTIKHKNYGFLASFCRFAPPACDSIINDTLLYEASIEVKPEKFGYYNARRFRQFRMFYGNCKSPVQVVLTHDGIVLKDTLYPTSTPTLKTWHFDGYTDHFSVKFKGYDSPDVYGIAFDDERGVAVDNIALRGNSGTIFTSVNYNNLSTSSSYLNTRLIILQFGGNVLPWVKSEDACKSYSRSFLAQIKRLKRINPNAAILVVGPADKSVKDKDKYASYEYLDPLVKYMKEAAEEGGAAYWDTYKAMGGDNSMPAWVDAGLAGKDYIHFSIDGASVIANMLYNAIIYDYNNYVKKVNKKVKVSVNG